MFIKEDEMMYIMDYLMEAAFTEKTENKINFQKIY